MIRADDTSMNTNVSPATRSSADGERAERGAPSEEARAHRLTPFVALSLGVALLAAGLLFTASATAQEKQQQRTLQRDAAQVSASFSSYFERARSINLLLAQNQAFAMASPGAIDVDVANRALRFLEV